MADSSSLIDPDTKRAALAIAAGIVVYLLVGLFLWWLLNVYIDPSAIKEPSKEATVKKELVQALGFIMAGLAGAIGIIFTWRNLQQGQANLRLTQEGLKQTQEGTQQSLQITREQLKLSREEGQLSRQGQITERFTRAIDQLGAADADGKPKLETRLGAIYALERIARDSERDYWPIMELFANYIRHNAPWPPKKSPEEGGFPASLQVSHREQEMPNNSQVGEPEVSPTMEIQAILRVFWRRGRYFGKGEDYRLYLRNVDLRGGIIGATHLEGALLAYANLEKAFLEGAYMREAYLQGAHLERSNLREAHLEDAALHNAHLQGANLQGANLQGANLLGANLLGANLQGANLQGANLQGAKVTDEQLANTLSLQGATMPNELKRT
jgi:hypothetical protein